MSKKLWATIHYLVITIAISIIYFKVTRFQFLFWEDHSHVFENPLLNPPTLQNLLRIWTQSYHGFYIPLTYSAWGLLNALFGFSAGAFHLLNLVFHILNSLLLFKILSRISKKPESEKSGFQPALLATLVFALHPIQVETVAWVTGFKDLLPTSLSLGALWYFIDRKYKFCTLLTFLALLAKPSAVVLPILFLIVEWFFVHNHHYEHRLKKHPLRHWALFWFALAAPVAFITIRFQEASGIYYHPPYWLRPFIVTDSLSFYLSKVFFPIFYTPVYARTPLWVLQHETYAYSWILPATLYYFSRKMIREKPEVLGGLAFTCVGLLPVLGIIPFLHQNVSTVADHYFYFPFVGLILILNSALPALSPSSWSPYSKSIYHGICTTVILALALRTWFQLPLWQNDEVLFKTAQKYAPTTPILYGNYGVSLFRRGLYDQALNEFGQAIKLREESVFYNNIGAVYYNLGKKDLARQAYEKAFALEPHPDIHFDTLQKNRELLQR